MEMPINQPLYYVQILKIHMCIFIIIRRIKPGIEDEIQRYMYNRFSLNLRVG